MSDTGHYSGLASSYDKLQVLAAHPEPGCALPTGSHSWRVAALDFKCG